MSCTKILGHITQCVNNGYKAYLLNFEPSFTSIFFSESDVSSDEDDDVHKRHRSRREEWEADIGKVVCVELGDKKKQKDNWFPGLVVAPTAQDSVKIETKKDYLVRSFQDGR